MDSKIDDVTVTRLNYNTDNNTCTAGWKVWYYHPNCIISSYPKEWLATEIQADALLGYDLGDTMSFEPFWKLIMANKAVLPLLWKKYPNHKYLLPAFFHDPRGEFGSDYKDAFADRHWVSKPLFGREGLGVFYSQNYTNSTSFDKFVSTTEDNFGKDKVTN
jgi:glutathionylspermidine synthase